MSKGERTKEAILRQAAELFNKRGFFGAALSDVMGATGLEKGGIYNHFENKEDLAMQAFDYAVDLIRQEFIRAVRDKQNAVEQLRGIVSVFRTVASGFPIAGGCPVMNTAIESDDAHPHLRERAQRAMDEWHLFVRRTVRRGQKRGEIRQSVDPRLFSTVLISVLEGAIMQSRLYGSVESMDATATYLDGILERDIRSAPAERP